MIIILIIIGLVLSVLLFFQKTDIEDTPQKEYVFQKTDIEVWGEKYVASGAHSRAKLKRKIKKQK